MALVIEHTFMVIFVFVRLGHVIQRIAFRSLSLSIPRLCPFTKTGESAALTSSESAGTFPHSGLMMRAVGLFARSLLFQLVLSTSLAIACWET